MEAEIIRSRSNPFVKRLVRLRERRIREREGVMLVEGARELDRAVAAGRRPLLLAYCPEAYSREASAVAGRVIAAAGDSRRLGPEAFAKASLRDRPDGLLGVVAASQPPLDALSWPPGALYLVMAGLEKPGNVGALLRSADAVACDAVFVTGTGTDLGNPNVVRASMGSVFSRPVLQLGGDELRAELGARGVRLVATSPDATRDYWSVALTGSVAVVVGPEDEGLDAAWLAAADDVVAIPMQGAADSLNVATSGALVLFEALRQRSRRGPQIT